MTSDEKLDLVKRHYELNSAGNHAAARELLTDDFIIEIPSCMPFAGVFRGKDAFRELIPIVVNAVELKNLEYIATTVGDDHVIELCDFTFEGGEESPTHVAEVFRFRGNQICEVRPFYSDPDAFVAAAERRTSAGISALIGEAN